MSPNPACAGQGPTAPAGEYGRVQFVVLAIACVYMVITAIVTVHQRKYRRRLRVRSMLPILVGSTGGVVFIMTRAVYDLIGYENFPCTLNQVLFYSYPIVIVGADVVSIIGFMAKQFKRQALNANTFLALTNLETAKLDADDYKHHRATVREYFQGLWNFLLGLFEVMSVTGRFDERLWFKTPHVKMSLVREMSYETCALVIFTFPYTVALIARIFVVPALDPANGCLGCLIFWEDVVIVTALTLVLSIPTTIMIRRVKTQKIPDPLYYIWDMDLSMVIMMPLSLCAGFLFAFDPNGLMRAQKVDWMIFEFATITYIHTLRTTVQLFRTSRMHKLGQNSVKLLDILSDAKGAILFEKHLIGELANENLLFWREAVKYKLQFDKNRDFDVSQQTAKVIYRTFLSPSAVLPINIGSDIKRATDARFRGTVGRTVFDDALVEVYLMMQNGAFLRFVNSSAFKEFSKTRADFSMSTIGVFNPMAVLPSDRESGAGSVRNGATGPGGGSSNIREYINSL